MVAGIDSALSGLLAAGKTLETTAKAIAKPAENTQVAPQDSVTLSPDAAKASSDASQSSPEDNVMKLVTASYDFKANAKSLKIQGDTLQSLLDIKS
jgi:hypothetical protein